LFLKGLLAKPTAVACAPAPLPWMETRAGARGLFLLVSTLLVAPALFAADDNPWFGDPSSARRPGRYRLGPVYFTPRLELRNAGVDTNVYGAGHGMTPDNIVALRTGLAAAFRVGRRLRLTSDGWVDWNYYQREASERSHDLSGYARAELDVASFTLFGQAGGGQARERLWLDLDRRVLRQEESATIGVTLRLARRVRITASGAARSYRYGRDAFGDVTVSEMLDRDERTASAQLRYALTRRTTLAVVGDAIEHRFVAAGTAGARSGRSYRTLAGFEFGEKALLAGRFLAGLRQFPASEAGGLPAYRGPALSAALVVPVRVARIDLTADRDVLPSVLPVTYRDVTLRNTFVSTRWNGVVSFGLPLRLIARGTLGLQEAKYLLPSTSNGNAERRVDHVWIVGGSLLRAVTDTLRIGGSVTRIRRVSNVRSESFEGLRYGIQAELLP
jgi:hypothetical protein